MSVTRSARKNRLSGKSTRNQAIAAISAATSLVAWAAVSKADTFGFNNSANTLNTPAAWTNETSPPVDAAPPGGNDTAQFDSLAGLSSTTTLTLGQNTTWGGLTVLNPGAAIVIGNLGDSGNTLTLGAASPGLANGINMSAASQNLTIVDPIAMAINQSFLVDASQTLTLNGSVGISTATLTFGGGGTQIVNGVISDGAAGGSILQSGPGTVILTGSNNYAGSTQLAGGVMDLNFNAAGAPSSNILPTAAQLRLEGGTLLVNGSASSASTQSFSSAATNGPTFVTPALSTIQMVDNSAGAHIPTVNLGTITANNISTNQGGLINFIGPATSTDGNNATPVAATGVISAVGTTTGTGGVILDAGGSAYAVVGQTNGQVTDYAALNGSGNVVGGSTVASFYTGGTTALTGNGDVNTVAEYRYSGGTGLAVTTLRFNTPTGGLYNGFGNNMDQIILKNNGKTLQTGAVLVTPNVGANNILICNDENGTTTTLNYQNIQPGGTAEDLNIFQYNTQAALILNCGIRSSHTAGYAQAGPGTVEINGQGAAGTTTGFILPTNLYGGLTILGNWAGGSALGSSSNININGGNLNADFTGNLDDNIAGTTGAAARPISVTGTGGSISATTGNVITIDGVISGSGALNIGYGAIATNEAVSEANNTVIQNFPSAPNTAGNGTIILTGANTNTGPVNINAGRLQIDTGTAGSGFITVGGSGNLSGTATLTNNASVASGGQLTPGDPITLGPTVGTLGLNSLALNSGSITNVAFASTTSFSTVNLTGNLNIANGAIFNIVQSGSSNPFTFTGTYDIFNVTGSVTLGTASFTSNAATYSLSDPTGHEVLLTIAGSTPETWNTSAGGSWAAAASWYPNGVPNSVGATAEFLADVGNTANPANGGVVTLDGNETVGAINFQNSNSYTIAPGSSIPSSVLHIQASGSGTGAITDTGGSDTFTSTVSLDSSSTNVTVSNSGSTITFSNTVEGVGALVINPTGAGTVLLGANNTYAGGTTINGGTLQVGTGGAAGNLGTSTTPIINKGALIMDVSTNQTLSVGPTSANGTGSITQNGAGTLTFTGANNASAFTVNHGAVVLGTSASLTTSGDLTMAGGTTLDLNGNSATVGGLAGSGTITDVAGAGTPTLTFGGDGNSNTFSGVIQDGSGTVSVAKAGNGTETFSTVNSYSGGTTIGGGALLVTQGNGTTSGVGTGAITVSDPNGLQLGNGVTLNNPISINIGSAEFEDVPTGSATLGGAIVATGSNQYRVGTISPTSTLTLTGASTGGTSSIFIITRGNIVVDGSGASITSSHTTSAMLIGRQTTTSTLNLTIENGGQLNSADGMDFGSGTATSDDQNIVLAVQGASSVNAGGTFNLNDDLNTGQTPAAGYSYDVNLALSGASSLTAAAFTSTSTANTNTGVTISGGSSIIASASDALTNATPAGTIFMPEFTNGNLVTAAVFVSIGTGGAIINNGGFNITIGEALADGGGTGDTLGFSGTGTTVIANSNSYSGNTTISAGTVVAANGGGSAFSSGAVNVTGGVLATASASRIALLAGVGSLVLDSSGPGVITGPVVVGAAGTLAPGEVGAGNFGTMTLSGLTTVASSTIDFDLNTGTTSAPTSATGDELLLTGTATIGSGTDLTFDGTGTIGDYYRIMGGSAISGNIAAIAADFVLPPGYTLNTAIDPGFIDVLVSASGPASLTWNDASSNNTWDTASSSNWNNGSATTVFHAQDNVTFNDSNGSAAGRYAVTLNTTVSPGSVLVNNTTGNYTISGTGTIGGTGSLTKSGTGTLTLSTPNTYTGGTTVTAGRLLIEPTSPSSSALAHGALSVSGSGIVQLADNVTAGTALGASNVNLTSLSLSGSGTLDIGNNRVIVDYTSSANDPITSIAAWIKNGFYNLAGPQILSSDIAADDAASGLSYGIGYADGADGLVAGLPSGEIEIMFTLLGDANLDGIVNSEDFTPFSANVGKNGSWDDGDFNYDGTVNSEDFTPFSANLGKSATLAAAAGALEPANSSISLANVPEPASTGLLTMGLVSVLARRRRKAKA